MNLEELLNYFNRSNTDVLGSLPSMFGLPVSPTPIPNTDNADYDMVGFNMSNGSRGINGHYPDEFKLPNHNSFSKDSKYSNNIFEGGDWYGPQGAFDPSAFNLKQRSLVDTHNNLQSSGDQLYVRSVPDYASVLRSNINQLEALSPDSFSKLSIKPKTSIVDDLTSILKQFKGTNFTNTIEQRSKKYKPMFDEFNGLRLQQNLYDEFPEPSKMLSAKDRVLLNELIQQEHY